MGHGVLAFQRLEHPISGENYFSTKIPFSPYKTGVLHLWKAQTPKSAKYPSGLRQTACKSRFDWGLDIKNGIVSNHYLTSDHSYISYKHYSTSARI